MGPLYLDYLLYRSLCRMWRRRSNHSFRWVHIVGQHNGWTGICQGCGNKQDGRWEQWGDRWQFVRNLRRHYPHEFASGKSMTV